MAESIRIEAEVERLVALQALETFRALRQAVKTAPQGQGLATVEAVVRDQGFEHLAQMYQQAIREHPEAQKGGPQFPLRMRQERRLSPGEGIDRARGRDEGAGAGGQVFGGRNSCLIRPPAWCCD